MASVDGGALGAGLALGLASLLSVGPSSLMMIREGVRRGRMWRVGLLVIGSELSLLVAACASAEAIDDGLAPIRCGLTWLGIAAVGWFAAGSLRAALSRQVPCAAVSLDRDSGPAMIRRVMAVVWLNPLTYVDLVLIPSALCRSFPAPTSRLQFGLGIGAMAIVACCGCLLAGSVLAPLLQCRRVMRMFDATSGVLMTGIAVNMTREILAVPL